MIGRPAMDPATGVYVQPPSQAWQSVWQTAATEDGSYGSGGASGGQGNLDGQEYVFIFFMFSVFAFFMFWTLVSHFCVLFLCGFGTWVLS